MSDEPTFPDEAAVGAGSPPTPPAPPVPPAAPTPPTPPAPGATAQRKNLVRTGVAVGIGSAAIVAALLYANRGRRGEREEG